MLGSLQMNRFKNSEVIDRVENVLMVNLKGRTNFSSKYFRHIEGTNSTNSSLLLDVCDRKIS